MSTLLTRDYLSAGCEGKGFKEGSVYFDFSISVLYQAEMQVQQSVSTSLTTIFDIARFQIVQLVLE